MRPSRQRFVLPQGAPLSGTQRGGVSYSDHPCPRVRPMAGPRINSGRDPLRRQVRCSTSICSPANRTEPFISGRHPTSCGGFGNTRTRSFRGRCGRSASLCSLLLPVSVRRAMSPDPSAVPAVMAADPVPARSAVAVDDWWRHRRRHDIGARGGRNERRRNRGRRRRWGIQARGQAQRHDDRERTRRQQRFHPRPPLSRWPRWVHPRNAQAPR
jgi:hypothetical protein